MTGQMPERVWLHHPDLADPFHCPADAVEAWTSRGWKPCDEEPEEVNPAVAEAIEWRRQQAEVAAEEAEKDTEPAKTKKPRAGSATESAAVAPLSADPNSPTAALSAPV